MIEHSELPWCEYQHCNQPVLTCFTPMPLSSKRKLYTLDAGRGIAALAVTLHHAGQATSYRNRVAMGRPFAGLALGVAYFFVLSGTVMMLAHWKHIGKPGYALEYLRKRARRIYPLYWLAVVAWLCFALRSLPPVWALTDGAVLVRFFADDYKFFPPSWTLYHEISFYMVFLCLILHKRFGTIALGAWWLAALLSFRLHSLDFAQSPSSVQLLFGLGVFAGWLLIRGQRTRAPWLLAVAGAALLSALCIRTAWIPLQQGTYLAAGAASLMLVIGAAELESRERLRIPAVFQFFGGASYALYLFHPMFLVLGATVLRQVQHHIALSDWTCLVSLFTLAVAGGCAVHLCIERPMMRWVNRPRLAA